MITYKNKNKLTQNFGIVILNEGFYNDVQNTRNLMNYLTDVCVHQEIRCTLFRTVVYL